MRLIWRAAFCVAGVVWFSVCQRAVATDSGLPDGTEYVSWERPLQFSKTYYVDCNSAQSNDSGPGTRSGRFAPSTRPPRCFNPASGWSSPRIYRRVVRPARGGTGPDQMISYEAAPGATVIVRGLETLNDGWQAGSVATRGGGGGGQVSIWQHALTGAMFPDAYNPFALASVPGDWSWLDTKKVDMGPYFRRRGLVFVDGKPLEPVEQARELGKHSAATRAPTGPGHQRTRGPRSATACRRAAGGRSCRKSAARRRAGSGWTTTGNVMTSACPRKLPDIRRSKSPPASRRSLRCKAAWGTSASKASLSSTRATVSRRRSAAWFPPPAATTGSSKATPSNGPSASGWTSAAATANTGSAPQAGASHIVRGNTIRYCGVEGIGGMGTQNTLVEDNLIEWIGWADAERAWEAAGAKFHRRPEHALPPQRRAAYPPRQCGLAGQRQLQLPHHRQCVRRRADRQRRHSHRDEPQLSTRLTTT